MARKKISVRVDSDVLTVFREHSNAECRMSCLVNMALREWATRQGWLLIRFPGMDLGAAIGSLTDAKIETQYSLQDLMRRLEQ